MLSHQKIVLVCGDTLALLGAFCAMALIRFDVGAQGVRIWDQLGVFVALFALWLIVLFIFDLYDLRRINPNPRTIGLLIAAMTINALIGIVIFYFIPIGISPKTNLFILVVAAFLFIVLWRRVFYVMFTKHFVRRIVVIGDNTYTAHLVEELSQNRHIGKVVATWSSVPEHDTSEEVHLIIADTVEPKTLLRFSQSLNTETLSLTEAYETIFAKIPVELMTDERAIEFMNTRTTPALHVAYRIIEITFALLILIITSPILLIAVIARLVEDGTPIFIKQHRVGKGGKIFSLYKLRSMRALSSDGSAEIHGAQWANGKKDMRITPVGAILRKTHIDEIPQMWNIIKGDLALIGPRPERPEFVALLEQEIPYYYLRHTIRPGFTGWAQIKFRYAATVLDSREKFEYDLYYLKNKHPLLDIGIVLKTLQIIFTH